MKLFYTLIISGFFTSGVFSQSCDSLFSPCIATFSRNGFYFDLEADSTITVTGFSYLTQNAGTRDISVYYRQGTYFGFEGIAANWTLLGTHAGVTPLNAFSCPLPFNQIDITFSTCIPQGMAYGFYIVMNTGTGTLESHSNLIEGSIGAQDANVKLITGKGQQGIGIFSGNLTPDLTFQGGIYYDCGCSPSSIQELKPDVVVAFPNPTSAEINFSGAAILKVTIFDIAGNKIITSNETTINVSSLGAGIYFAVLTDVLGRISHTRFVKE